MKKFYPFYIVALLVISLLIMMGSDSVLVYAQDAPTPTPTYDPLAEPYLPENPSEYELGRNWYWHNCMTCHGDMGQGLTDEFRAVWPEDHQNCWEHGCHGGHMDDEGFPIPTIVPPLVSNEKLAQFSSEAAFHEFLKSTHPPQDPGCLEDEEYLAIVRYVFNMNDRVLGEPTATPTVTPAPSSTPFPDVASTKNTPHQTNKMIYIIGLGIILAFVVIWSVTRFRTAQK